MKWPFVWLLAAGCLTGCSGSGQTLDPFLGRATVPPPVTGQLAPANVTTPYYQGNPMQGAPPAGVVPNQTQPPVYNSVPPIGPVGSNSPTHRPVQQKLGRLLAESPADREYRVGRVRLAASNNPVMIVNDEASASESVPQTVAQTQSEFDSPSSSDGGTSEARTVSATEPATQPSFNEKKIATRSGAQADSEQPIRIPEDRSAAEPRETVSLARRTPGKSAENENTRHVEPEPFAAPNDAVEIADLPKVTNEQRSPRVNRSAGGFRPALSSTALSSTGPTRPSPVTIRRSTALANRESVSSTASPTRSITPTTAASKTAASRATPQEQSPSLFGHAEDYDWIKGKLEYLQSKRQWKLRYIPIDGETDEYGGSVVVEGDVDLSDYRPGDFVALQGKLDTENIEPGTFAPLYLTQRVKRLSK